MALSDFSSSLPMLLYRALDAVMPGFRQIFNDHGITEQQWRVLRVLVDAPEIAASELAECTAIAAPSLVGVLDRMERAELVERRRGAADRRRVLIVATPAGRALQAQLSPLVGRTYSELMQRLPPREWARLIKNLERLADPAPKSP